MTVLVCTATKTDAMIHAATRVPTTSVATVCRSNMVAFIVITTKVYRNLFCGSTVFSPKGASVTSWVTSHDCSVIVDA
mgnify:FL=1